MRLHVRDSEEEEVEETEEVPPELHGLGFTFRRLHGVTLTP